DQTSKGYVLGEALANMGTSYLDVNELRSHSMNWADPLASRTGEAVRVGTLVGGDVLVVHYVFNPSNSPQSADVGSLLPAHATALGKTLLAFLPAAAAVVTPKLATYTARTLTDRYKLAADLAETRECGYAVEFGEYAPNQASIAAPIRGHGGLVVAAVAIHGQVDRLCKTSGSARPGMVAKVRECADAITRELQVTRSGS
ncbi:MAG: IclR family transcriptional regulator C-terminal domain-containing protein, partial [Aeromicrobium sp.]